MIDYKKYFNILRWSINPDYQSIPDTKGMDWYDFYQFACEQAIAGVAFEGVKRMSDARGKMEENRQPQESEPQSKPPFNLLMEWIGMTEQIAGQNRILNRRCAEVVKEYQEAGFQCCVLKGQGNAARYGGRGTRDDGSRDSLALRRTPGDIDLWVLPKEDGRGKKAEGRGLKADGRCKKGDVREIIKYVRERHPEKMDEVRYYHMGYEDKGIEVEVHFMPNIMNNPVYHRRLQKWYKKMAEGGRLMEEVELPEGVGSIPVPTAEFNIVFQLAHMMHHFFDEGIGLRQFVDYYYVLMEEGRRKMDDVADTLQYLGLWKFAGAVMYVMQEVFHLDKAYMIAPVDERRGKTLMEEILKGGNFGRYSGLTNHSAGGKYIAKTLRNFRLVREYPAEALCEPVFRTWHFLWRKTYGSWLRVLGRAKRQSRAHD